MNPGAAVANVSVRIEPCSMEGQASIGPGQEAYVTIPPGSVCTHPINCPNVQCPVPMGGPVTVRSSQPVLASQRVQWYDSLNEIWSASAAQATSTSYFNWYDKASSGMFNDNIHVFNVGSTSATVTISVPGASPQVVTLGAEEKYVFFPGTIGGPVTVSSTQPVLASQRVQYYQTFNEIWSG
jgi:hypothetical protein